MDTQNDGLEKVVPFYPTSGAMILAIQAPAVSWITFGATVLVATL